VRVQAEVSLYPLRTRKLSGALETFRKALLRDGIQTESGAMSTRVAGESDDMFAALQEAFALVAAEHDVVMVLKMANGCPENF